MSDINFTGKVAIVTGAARGFGAEFAKALALKGASVLITDILTDLGTETAAQISADGGVCRFAKHDVRDDTQWQLVTDQAVAEFQGLDLVINNAGVEISELFIDTDPQSVRDLLDINIIGTMLGIKHGFRAMQPEGTSGRGGTILNLSSVAGITSTPGVAAYSASKAAIISLTEVAAVESGALGYGVRVNCLCPSLIDTDMGRKLIDDFSRMGLAESTKAISDYVLSRTPLARFGTPVDVVAAGLYLCSDTADFITGVSLPVDGGMSLT